MTFNTEVLESAWKEMNDYEREHFGLKYGDDFNVVAQALRASEQFMRMGGLALMLSTLDTMGLRGEIEKATDKQAAASAILTRPNGMHNIMAEIFYLGYRIGKKEGETLQLENLARGERP